MRLRRTLFALAAAAGLATPVGPSAPAVAENGAYLWETFAPTAGPLGGVSFIGDSVGIGAERFAPTLSAHLAAHGWGPIRFRAVAGGRTGLPPGWGDHVNAPATIAAWRAQGWDSEHWIVNLGANDSGYCDTSVACAREAILLVVDAIGPGHRIWWPMITRYEGPRFSAQEATWNLALAQIDAERDDFVTWDWPTELRSRSSVYQPWDGTHLSPDGYRERSRVMAEMFTAAFGGARRVGSDATLPPTSGPPLGLVAVAPQRAFDSRTSGTGAVAGGTTLAVDLKAALPAGAVGAVVNLTAAGPSGPGHLTAFPCGTSPPAGSHVNHDATTRAASALVRLAADTTLCVRAHTTTHVVVDVQAALVPLDTPGALRMRVPAAPRRLADTRASGRAATLRVALPEPVEVVAVNLTATGAERAGHLTAHRCDAPLPPVSNVNYLPGATVAGFALVALDGDDAVCVSASAPVDVVVDLMATFAADGALAFQPGVGRLLDTRSGAGGWLGRPFARQVLDVGVAPPEAVAVSGTLIAVAPNAPSFVAVGPAGTDPATATTSNVNADTGAVVANAFTVAAPDGRVTLFGRAAGHVVLDVAGWWLPA